jgi:hypothetical protein
MNVNNETLCLAAFDAAEKRFGRCKRLNAESVRRQEAAETFQHAWIVFNDCNGEHAIANLIAATGSFRVWQTSLALARTD